MGRVKYFGYRNIAKLSVSVRNAIFVAMMNLSADLSRNWTGDDVKRMVEKHGITQQHLAEVLGIRIATVSDWVRGAATPSRLASVVLTYLDLDLGGKMRIKGNST